MDWYVVVKTINGRQYYYKQKTWREGNRVRTRSVYLCPVNKGRPSLGGGWSSHPDLSGATTLPLPFGEVTSDAAAFVSEEMVSEIVSVLSDPSRAAVGWMLPWGRRRGEIKVVKDARIDGMIRKLGVRVTSQSAGGAYYRPVTDTINLPALAYFVDRPGQSATAAWHSTFFHELVHWTKRSGRSTRSQSMDNVSYAREELVAELGAVLLMRVFKIDEGNIGLNARYFQSWMRRAGNEREALTHAAREAEKAVNYILEHGKVQL